VSEAGFMMDNETLQVLIGHFVELKDKMNAVSAGQEELKMDINGVKTDISAVTAGQEELKTDINGVKTDINGVKTDIGAVTAGKEELKNDMKSEISAVKSDIEKQHQRCEG
jgi:uncharacterized protein YoxC